MLDNLGLGTITPQAASAVAGGLIGIAFGILAQQSRFCLRRGLTGADEERASALGTWLCGFAVALAGTTLLVSTDFIDVSKHRFHSADLPIFAIIIGGLMFGAGMFLARGCASRMTVLAGSGNLRALTTLMVFAISAHATIKGALAPIRTGVASVEIGLGPIASLANLPGGSVFWTVLAVSGLGVLIARSGAPARDLVMGGLIGTLVPLGWLVTGYMLADDFSPIPMESLTFTSSASEALFWWVAATAIAPGFGTGLLLGALAGSMLSSIALREFKIEGFSAQTPTGRYLAGGMLMGIGGALAGGCTVGAGLTGSTTLSVAALLAIGSIVAGTILTQRYLSRICPRSAETTLAICQR